MKIIGRPLIPQKYLKDYTQRKASLTKARLELLCVMILVLYISVTILTLAFYSSSFDPREIPVGILLIAGTLAALFLNGKVKGLTAIKINTYFFVLLCLVFLTRIGIVYKEYFSSCASLYLLALFAISFTIPWASGEITAISAMYLLAFSRLFIYVRRGTPAAAHAELLQEYADGMLLIIIGFLLCFVIKRKDNAREIENYLFFKQIETKNEQMRAELELATKIHKTLIPHSINTDKADIAVTYLPMYYIGGDYAKFQFVDKDRLFFIIADVTGHGVSAALMVNRLHTEVERLMREGKGPGALLNELNDLIIKKFEGISIFLSAFAAILDFNKNTLVYSNHGHPTQYLYHITESFITRLPSQASLLGILETGDSVDEHSVEFHKGDRILLFTDGVIEVKDERGGIYGEKRLENFIEKNYFLSVEEFNTRLLSDLNLFKKGEFEDDVFILNIYTKPENEGK